MTETLLEHNRAKSSLMGLDELDHFTTQKEFTRCGLCENNCALTVTIFNDGSKFVTGNRCERGAEKVTKIKFDRSNQKENLVDYKYKKLFKFKALAKRDAVHGIIGVPRVLNMYENYPLWHTILTDLGFRVQLSPKSDKKLFEKGIETIPSDTVCYPAKMVHGHIQSLIDRKVDAIFYPSVIYEQIENSKAPNHYNCPIVQSYPEVIEKNMDPIRNGEVKYFHPFVNLADHESVVKSLIKAFSKYEDITAEDIQNAVEHGYQALADFKQDLQDKADELLSTLALKGEKAIVLSGRPYHLDPEINHGIANIITQEGFHVLTEDMVAGLEEVSGLRVVNQWVYHSRLYAAAKVVSKNPNLELVQLNSFGCGLDAVTTDQVEEIMRGHNKLYTVLKIDEGSNLGAIRIRLRSLKAAVEVGLKFVHNDACYPAIISIGQLIEALQSGKYDLDNTSVMMTQTGGGCRATNYIPLLRKALKDAGFPQVPVVSISMGNQGTEETPGWSLTYSFVKRLLISVLYGDLFERVLYRVRPYEAVPGSANALYDKWLEIARKNVMSGSYFEFNHNMKRIIKEFDSLETVDFGQKPRVGVVGEILVKYAPTANNDIVSIIENEGGEAVVPDLIGFMNYSLFNQIWKADELNMSQKAKRFAKLGIDAINLLEKPMNKALEKSERFEGIESIYDIAEGASKIISIGNHTGEGWFLTGEMIELLNNDVKNIVCLQPFGCLPNHIVGKGMVKELRRQYKAANITPIDYDPGSSEVNQLNRIRLMMTTAKKCKKQHSQALINTKNSCLASN